ncbi:MAG TPA: EAL domain-containing protein [Trichocoleus sp.]
MSTVLVIEDEPQVQSNICEILELADYQTLSAGDGLSGVRIAQESLPDLIICDVMMPLLNGYEVIAQLRQNPSTANIPFVFLTAKTERDSLRYGMQLGADDYLSKPFSPEELLDAIAIRLSKHQTLVQKFTHQLEQVEEAVQYLKHYDRDTGLPNYHLLEKHFDLTKIYAHQQENSLAVLIVELEQLEQISGTLGHRTGKLLLEAFAQRLLAESHSPYCPLEVVSYLGGRQFGVLSRPLQDQSQISGLAKTLLERLWQPFVINGQEIFVKPVIGISVYPENGEALDLLLGCAESALFKQRKLGDSPFHFYASQQHVRALERLTLESKLHHALENNELQVFYQPQFELHSQRLIGAEALIRWYLPERGFISPMDLIPIAEETGLIIPIGAWVLETACAQACQWQQPNAAFKISVNLSAQQFYHPDLAGQVSGILAKTGLAPERLVLEITESSILEDTQKALNTLGTLKSLGVEVAIDDFGTGYSSLSCLKQFPFDVLKIDQSFVRNIHEMPDNIPITRIIIQLAKELKLDLVAEGIETDKELNFLLDNACQIGQGYLFGRPVTSQEFTKAFLEAG